MRRARVYRDRGVWVVRLYRTDVTVYDPLDGGEFHFSKWTDAGRWAVRMVGA